MVSLSFLALKNDKASCCCPAGLISSENILKLNICCQNTCVKKMKMESGKMITRCEVKDIILKIKINDRLLLVCSLVFR